MGTQKPIEDEMISPDDVVKKYQTQPETERNPEDLPWYMPDVKKLVPEARKLLEEYCKVPSDEVLSRVKQARDEAFKIFPYPCLGRFAFLEFSIRQSLVYDEVLQRIKNGDKYLDIGCCVGQDIRKLVFDGAPSENTYGSDLEAPFMEIGYDLFLDRPTLKTTFIGADIFKPDSDLKQIDGQIDIVHAASFLHLFSWEGQVQACKRVVLLIKAKPGGLVIGRQLGNVEWGEQERRSDPSAKRFRHNVESFERMWKRVGEETGTEWKVDAKLEDKDLYEYGKTLGKGLNFIPPGTHWLTFVVRRL